MDEFLKVLGLTLLFIFAGIFAILYNFYTPPYYKNIDININTNSRFIIIHEKFSMVMPHGSHVQYRSFMSSITLLNIENHDTLNPPKAPIRILSVTCSIGKPYVVIGDTTYRPNGSEISIPSNYYRNNEVGCYNPAGYKGGEIENLAVVYEVPISYVRKENYKYYLFSRSHPAIWKLVIKKGEITREFYYILPDLHIWFDVRDLNSDILYINTGLILLVILSAMFPFIVWYFFGRDPDIVVPKYLSRPPVDPSGKPLPYCLAGYLLKSRVDRDILASILLRLKYLGIIVGMKIKKSIITESKAIITINKQKLHSMSNYLIDVEKDFVSSLFDYGKTIKEDNLYITRRYSGTDLRRLASYIDATFGVWIDNEVIFDKGKYILMAYGSLLIIFFQFIFKNILPFSLEIYFLILGAFCVLSGYTFLYSIYSKFKDGWYRTYLETNAFKNFLSDIAMLKKYGPEDIVIWSEWLLYATAFGVSKKVIKAMKEKFPFEYVEFYNTMILLVYSIVGVGFPPLYEEIAFDFVLGGGFGGGGGGAR